MIHVINHPLIKDKLTRIRKKECESTKFRNNLGEITQLMIYEATKHFEVKDITIETPICVTKGQKLTTKIVLVPILRAGLGMVDSVKELIPTAAIGHIGIFRNEKTLTPTEYYFKMPKTLNGSNVIILDPMLATGGSAIATIKTLKKHNKPKEIIIICIVASPEGLKKITDTYNDVKIYVAAIDEKLDENGYIMPGLGDAGDRIFGTK